MSPRSLPGLFPEELDALVQFWGQPAYRGRQIFEWMHRHGVLEPSSMTNLPRELRERLGALATEEVQRLQSQDGLTSKLLLKLHDDQQIEVVEMRTATGRKT